MFGFITLCIVWGFTWIAIKVSLEGLPPYLGAGLRFTLALVVVFLYILWKKVPLKVSRREFRLLAVSGFLVYTLDYGLIYWGEQYINGSVAAIFFATFPLFTAIFTNFLFRHEPFSRRRFIGLLIGFLGVVIVFYDQLALTEFNRLVLLGSLGVIIGAACAAFALGIVKKHLPTMSPLKITFHQLWIGTISLLLIGIVFEDVRTVHLNGRIITAVLYLSVVGSAFAFVLWYRLLQKMSAITLSLVIYITPVVALLGDYILFREIISVLSFVGMAVIFIGISQTQKDAKILSKVHHKLRLKIKRSPPP